MPKIEQRVARFYEPGICVCAVYYIALSESLLQQFLLVENIIQI
jgi:hypothetical protein